MYQDSFYTITVCCLRNVVRVYTLRQRKESWYILMWITILNITNINQDSIVTECYLRNVVSVCTLRQCKQSWYISDVLRNSICSSTEEIILTVRWTVTYRKFLFFWGILVSFVFSELRYKPQSHAYFSNDFWKKMMAHYFKRLHKFEDALWLYNGSNGEHVRSVELCIDTELVSCVMLLLSGQWRPTTP